MDEIVRAVTADGFVKLSVITARGMVQRANEIHACTPTTSAALGRALCAASLAFPHPLTGEALRFDAPPPAGFPWELFKLT